MSGRETKLLNLVAAVVSYMYSSAWIFPVLIVFGGVVTYIRDAAILKKPVNEAPGDEGLYVCGRCAVQACRPCDRQVGWIC